MLELEVKGFLDEKIDLGTFLKRLSKNNEKAIDVLVKMLDSDNENTRMRAATKILDYHVLVAKEISFDQMQRLVAELKLNPKGTKMLTAKGGNEQDRPLVDFHTIREV